MTAPMDQDATLENQEQTRYPVRQRRPPDRYGIYISLVAKLNSRRGVCSIDSPINIHVVY